MKKPILALVLASMAAGTTLAALADETNPAIVHRQGIYKTMAGHMTAMKSILFLGFEAPQDLSFHAQGILDSFMHMGNSYPPGSDKGETKAKPEIWSQPEKVKQRAMDAVGAAKDLVAATSGSDKKVMVTAFKTMGEKCKACHDDFRKE
ncbi:c-type cytochrome [Candidatus Magnetaquicoccus inordinatus]|uniref:c-type cytochrome n=1 Tax=Candidatus Magnetaquicoccus inordinatus TaxID=2496818 RepID=UPI00187D1B32|nr:cytochrome c [Candidatus Magnetaquicoccus inordinatus]